MGRRLYAVSGLPGSVAEVEPRTAFRLVNPLPTALGHYEQALVETLDASGSTVVRTPFPSVERADGGRPAAALRLTAARWRLASSPMTTVVLWPALGLSEPAWWRSGPTWLVVHDPRPLRPQLGYGRAATWLGARTSHRLAGVVVHSTVAADALQAQGWAAPQLLPHPALRLADRPGTRRDVAVLGQYKPSRDLQSLLQLAEEGPAGLDLRISGRGWPALPGWTVEDRFLSETEMDERFRSAAVVVVPYRQFFTSGIAVRALERLAPVVARSHPALVDLLGEQWPGFVRDNDWAGAVRRAADVPTEVMAALRDDYVARSQAAWAAWAEAVACGAGAAGDAGA
jgi:hypothetical protein